MENKNDRLQQYISVVPSPRQKIIQQMGFNAFIHYGMNTFTDKEWGDGKTPASNFNPTKQDTDQWVSALKDAGVQGVIITAKHHDGFCLWQTKTTEYSVKNSPYKDGKGDVVREVSDSCRKYGLKFGFYLSPWDRNSEYYGTPKYNDFYIEQLTELLTGYGDVFCVWLDGACGSYMDGKPKQEYDFKRIYETVRKYQPNACISSCGPDVRWVGNEAGYARKSEWNVVPKFEFDLQNIEDKSQQSDDEEFRTKGADVIASDLGSRKVLANYDEFIWYPAEVDVSIRPGWFFHSKENNLVRSLNNLLMIYYNSVGGNSLLLLNVPPSKEGLFHENDVKRLHELGEAIRANVSKPISVREVKAAPAENGASADNLLDETESFFSPAEEHEKEIIDFYFDEPKTFNMVRLQEQCDYSQRIEEFAIYALNGGKAKKVYDGTVVGFNRIALLKKHVKADGFRIEITSCRHKPYIKNVQAFEAVGKLPKEPWYKPIVVAIHQLNYKVYIARENRNKKKKS